MNKEERDLRINVNEAVKNFNGLLKRTKVKRHAARRLT